MLSKELLVVIGGSFNLDSYISPTGASTVVLVLSIDCDTNIYVKGTNWVTGSKIDQSSYRNKLAGVIATMTTILDVLIRHHNNAEDSITIVLDGESALNQSGNNWPLII